MSKGGIYKGPNGEMLHGDGTPVGSPAPGEGAAPNDRWAKLQYDLHKWLRERDRKLYGEQAVTWTGGSVNEIMAIVRAAASPRAEPSEREARIRERLEERRYLYPESAEIAWLLSEITSLRAALSGGAPHDDGPMRNMTPEEAAEFEASKPRATPWAPQGEPPK